jgi:hypothetical protein
MNKYLSKILLGSALSASSLVFAAESAPLALTEIQMDSVTAGTSMQHPPPRTQTQTRQTIEQKQGSTYNASFSPTVGANLAVINTGGQRVGANTVQTGGTQTATNR